MINYLKTVLLVVFTFISLSLSSQTEQELKDLAIENAKTVSTATIAMDFDTVLNYTYPSVLELMGGKEGAITLLKTQFDTMTAEGFVFEKADVKGIISFAKVKDEYHCILETFNQMKMPKMRITSKSFMFGIYDDYAKHWFFVEAKQLKNPAMRDMIFPDFYTTLELPDDEMTTEPIED